MLIRAKVGNFRKNPKNNFSTFSEIFFHFKKKFRKNIFTYVDPKFAQESRNHTYKTVWQF